MDVNKGLKFFLKIQKKIFFFFFFWGGGEGSGWGSEWM